MGLFNKILHAGEGRKLKLARVDRRPTSTRSSPRCRRRSDDELRALTRRFRERARPAPDDDAKQQELLDDLLPEAFAAVREARQAHARPAPLRRADHGRRGAALRLGRRDEDRRGQDPRRHAAARTSTRSPARGVHLVTVNDYLAKRDAEWMGQIYRFLGLEVGVVLPEIDDSDDEAAGVRRRHHLRHQQRVRLRLPPRQHGRRARGAGPARPLLRDRRRGRLDPHRRGPHAAHHLGPRRRRRRSSTSSSPAIVKRPAARPRLRGRRGEAHRRAHRGGHRRGSSRRSASTTSTSTSTRTSSTSSRPRCGPRSCSSATSTTSCRTAR